jgi:transcriptional regulator with XRE-family HTH domain
MPEKLTPQEVAILIRARRLLKEKGLSPDTDIKSLCEEAGISRKTGYQWEKQLDLARCEDEALRREHNQLKAEHEKLKKDYSDIRFENEGRKVAWEIHEVDKLLAEKKSIMDRSKKKKP